MTLLKSSNTKKNILIINNEIIDDTLTCRILKIIKNRKKIGLDMRNVQTIKSKKFIASLLENKFKLFNLKSEILTYLSIILKDGYLKSYVNENDFTKNKRELIKRRFLVA